MRSAVIIVLALLAIYVGAAMYTEIRLAHALRSLVSEKDDPGTYEGHPFRSKADMEIFISEEHRNKISPWASALDEWQALLILSACASFLGSVVLYFRHSLDKRRKAGGVYCLLGLAIGPCLMSVAWVSEALILEGESRFRPEMMAAVCFLAGIFVKESWDYVSALAGKIFAK
jgi:hypothetical protein